MPRPMKINFPIRVSSASGPSSWERALLGLFLAQSFRQRYSRAWHPYPTLQMANSRASVEGI